MTFMCSFTSWWSPLKPVNWRHIRRWISIPSDQQFAPHAQRLQHVGWPWTLENLKRTLTSRVLVTLHPRSLCFPDVGRRLQTFREWWRLPRLQSWREVLLRCGSGLQAVPPPRFLGWFLSDWQHKLSDLQLESLSVYSSFCSAFSLVCFSLAEIIHQFILEQQKGSRVPLCINPQSAAFKSFIRYD